MDWYTRSLLPLDHDGALRLSASIMSSFSCFGSRRWARKEQIQVVDDLRSSNSNQPIENFDLSGKVQPGRARRVTTNYSNVSRIQVVPLPDLK